MTPTKGALALASIDDLARVAKMIAQSGYFNVSPAQAAIKIMAGAELKLGPLQAMMNVHVITSGGRTQVTLAAGLVGSLIKRSGRYDYRVKTTSTVECVLTFTERLGERTTEVLGDVSWTIEEAKTAGLAGKHNWKTYPADMLFARALTRGARRFCPDVFGGPIYTPDEITGDPSGVPDMEVTPEPELGQDERGQDPVRDELLEDVVEMAAGTRPRWITNEIREDPIGGSSYFGEGVTWAQGLPDTPEGKAVRQKFHIWVSEAGRNYDDIRDWPLDAIKGQGVINLNRFVRGAADGD